MQDHLPPGITIVKSDNLEEWQMDIKVLDSNPLYQNQTYRLKFTFSNKYPIGNQTICLLPPFAQLNSLINPPPQNPPKSNLSNVHPAPTTPARSPFTPTSTATE